MNIVCFGLSHHTAPVAIRERFALPEHHLPVLLRDLRQFHPGIHEAVIVSTCNRVEIYAAADHLLSGPALFTRLLAGLPGADGPPPAGAFYHYRFPRSAHHLLRVVSGLDSMMLGETEILGQVKKAYAASQSADGSGKFLNRLFQSAFRAAKEVRSATAITRGPVSVAAAAVELSEKIFGDLGRLRALVLGAGETGERAARALLSRRLPALLLSNRSPERAESLALALGPAASTVPFSEWPERLHEADILVASTASPDPIVHPGQIREAMRRRPHRPLFLLDLAVPRDIDPLAGQIENVYLHDMDSLQSLVSHTLAARQRELGACDEILRLHLAEFSRWFYCERCRRQSGVPWLPPPKSSPRSRPSPAPALCKNP